MNSSQHKPDSGPGCFGLALLGGLAAFLLLFSGPGMLTMTFLRPATNPDFDTGQMWAFTGAISLGLWMALCLVTWSLRRGTIFYLVVAGLSAAAFWFSHFGLKTRATSAALALYFPESKEAAITDRAHRIHVSVEFENTPAPEAFEYIYQASKRADPEGKGVRIIYTSKYNTPPPRISDRLDNVAVMTVLNFIGSGLSYKIRPDAIYFYPQTETLD